MPHQTQQVTKVNESHQSARKSPSARFGEKLAEFNCRVRQSLEWTQFCMVGNHWKEANDSDLDKGCWGLKWEPEGNPNRINMRNWECWLIWALSRLKLEGFFLLIMMRVEGWTCRSEHLSNPDPDDMQVPSTWGSGWVKSKKSCSNPQIFGPPGPLNRSKLN